MAVAASAWERAHGSARSSQLGVILLFLPDHYPDPDLRSPSAHAPIGLDVARAHELGLAGTERIVRDPMSGKVAFDEQRCLEGIGCSCELGQTYRTYVEPSG